VSAIWAQAPRIHDTSKAVALFGETDPSGLGGDRDILMAAQDDLSEKAVPIAFGGPGAITVAGTGHRRARRYRRRQCATSRTITCQAS
jgi:hypothetical protein